MKLSLKNSTTHKIKVGEGVEGQDIFFVLDYPTLKQQEELDELKYDALGRYIKKEQEFQIDIAKFQKYKRAFIACVVKDWEGFTDENGKEVKIKLVNNKVSDDQIMELTFNEKILEDLYNLISKELEFTEEDKKKL